MSPEKHVDVACATHCDCDLFQTVPSRKYSLARSTQVWTMATIRCWNTLLAQVEQSSVLSNSYSAVIWNSTNQEMELKAGNSLTRVGRFIGFAHWMQTVCSGGCYSGQIDKFLSNGILFVSQYKRVRRANGEANEREAGEAREARNVILPFCLLLLVSTRCNLWATQDIVGLHLRYTQNGI